MERVQNSDDLVGEFENNSALEGGALIFEDLLDRCTLSPIAEIHKVNESLSEHFGIPATGIMYILNITNINFDDLKSHSIRSKPM